MRDLQNICRTNPVGEIRFRFVLDIAGENDRPFSNSHSKHDGAVVLRGPLERTVRQEHLNSPPNFAVAKQM